MVLLISGCNKIVAWETEEISQETIPGMEEPVIIPETLAKESETTFGFSWFPIFSPHVDKLLKKEPTTTGPRPGGKFCDFKLF